MTEQPQNWQVFKDTGVPNADWQLPAPPSWRPFGDSVAPGVDRRKQRADTFQMLPAQVDMINAAIYLRRPLLITGKPGTGKSSLAYKVAKELMLGEVLYWSITTRTTLKNGLYRYDAIGRLQETEQLTKLSQGQLNQQEVLKTVQKPESIGKYITLGPLGTALLPSDKPRILLIDEIDKSDIDLPNDLLSIFEEGWFEIPELDRIKEIAPNVRVRTAYSDPDEPSTWNDNGYYTVPNGRISCRAFPLVILTSNGERDFPPAFLRRCLRLRMPQPDKAMLGRIVAAHLDAEYDQLANEYGEVVAQERKKAATDIRDELIQTFLERRQEGDLATDQLLNAIFMVTRDRSPVGSSRKRLIKSLLKNLTSAEDLEDETDEGDESEQDELA
ncbi:AAA family ATPase [Leptothoe sp. PORK10 BA2]|uniref:AAA family ATPase n=1 Tax=Leptothoe sp. PORK10 BA2 TaxID=3110254 RepID=UPI002B20180D|nr:MoxR family ATPase [Leptothoe sp. PORK10 BA2]MEA5464604.1 MoxR family ATPase [Leptothoe sp. PORK10 BA2]